MLKKIEISFVEAPNEAERIQKIAEILSEGVYACLKKQGLLRENAERSKKIKLVLEKAKEISNSSDDNSEEKNY